MLQALVIKLDQVEYAKTFAMIQAVVNGEKAQEALEQYKHIQFPYLQKIQKDQRSTHIKRLMSEVSRGAISVTPLVQKKVQSKLRTKIVERQTEAHTKQLRSISRKIGGY